jgi:hypothetical protein
MWHGNNEIYLEEIELAQDMVQGRACSTHREMRNACRILWEIQKERGYQEYFDVCGRIILRWILEIQEGVVRTRLMRLRLETS